MDVLCSKQLILNMAISMTVYAATLKERKIYHHYTYIY